MATKQEQRYAAYKAKAGTTGPYASVKIEALKAETGLTGTINELEIAWLQGALSSSETNLASLKGQAAAAQGVARWDDLGSEIGNFFT